LHQIKNDWFPGIFPMVPGHEIVGKVVKVGSEVKNFKVGDLAGTGCMVNSCQHCENCEQDLEQYCLDGGSTQTYNSYERDSKTPTYGGYSNSIVVNEKFVLHILINWTWLLPRLYCAQVSQPIRHCATGKLARAISWQF
jgi:uncharacterized zinc-type alcohol dehydrogenase-like protein